MLLFQVSYILSSLIYQGLHYRNVAPKLSISSDGICYDAFCFLLCQEDMKRRLSDFFKNPRDGLK